MTGSLPLASTVGFAEASLLGNALAAAVALRHLQLFEELEVLANVRDRAAQSALDKSRAVAAAAKATLTTADAAVSARDRRMEQSTLLARCC